MKDLILPQGPSGANLMFILDYPTLDDATAGKGWTGNYTHIVKQLCKENQINYYETYRTLYYKTLLEYRGKGIKEKRIALEAARRERNYDEILKNEILQLRPRVVVPMGELSLQFTTLEKGITKFRGSVLPLRQDFQQEIPHPIYVIPTLPPEHIMAIPQSKSYIAIDYQKFAPQNLSNLTFSLDLVTNICESPSQLLQFILNSPRGPFGVFDIETKFNVPVCIGLSFDGKTSLTVPLLDNKVSQVDLLQYWTIIDKLLSDPDRKWANQNIKYDILLLHRFGLRIPEECVIGDTALRASLLYPELPKNLGFLNSIYNDIPYFKDEGKDNPDRKTFYQYCGKDCISTFRIFQKQQKDIEDLGIETFERQINNLFWPYIRLESRGLLIDQERLFKLRIEYENYYYTHLSTLRLLANSPHLNPRSPQQVGHFIYEELRYPIRRDRKTGSLATDEETLEELLAHQTCKHPDGPIILELIIACRKFSKIVEYCSTPIHPDNRMRNSYDLGGTRTGRSAGKATTDFLLIKEDNKYSMAEIGHSLQTIGKHGFAVAGQTYGQDLRSIFVPTPGFIFVEGDLSQAESRVDLVLSKDHDKIEQFFGGKGIHVLTGSWIYGYEIDKKKEPDKYHMAKTVRHAAERNMYPQRLSMMIQQSLKFCEEVLTKLHTNQPNLRKVFHEDVRSFVMNNRYLQSPHGRRRDFFGKPDHEMFNEAISQLPQSVVSDQIKLSLPMLEAELPEAYFCYEGHDALMAEVPPSALDHYCEVFKKIVERPIDFRFGSLPRDYDLVIPCELSMSETTWQEMSTYQKEEIAIA